MSYQPTPKQALLLWKLITAEGAEEREPMISKSRPQLTPKERKPLVSHGFVNLEKKPGRRTALFYVLTDKAWAWAADARDVELLKSRSSVGAEALQGLLRRLLPFLEQHDLALASVFSPGAPAATADDESPAKAGAAAEIDQSDDEASSLAAKIEAACLALGGGARKARIRLSALRQRLSSVERNALDAALLELQVQGRLVLYRDDNSAALTNDDHGAALIVGDAPRHLVYLEA